MSGLRVLITNKSFAVRGGAELYVRDLAEGLLERGHFPIVYSTDPSSEVAREIRALSVPFVEDLSQLGTPPDIIHGQDHVQTMIALLHFPEVPAVFVCHGWIAWEAMAPKFPRIRHYVAVDRVCRDRMVFENGIPENRTRILLNFVDLRRFKPRDPLPPTPKRALIFNNYATEKNSIGAIREACNRMGITLDVFGSNAGKIVANPESELGNYEIVFAKGRSALEALAVGATVIPCDKGRVGPMVSTEEFDHLRLLNFGWSALREPVDADVIEREIARYDAEDAGNVSRMVRATAGRDVVIDQIVALYRETIADNKNLDKPDRDEESRAAAAYMAWLTPAFRAVYLMENRASLAELAQAQALAESEQARARLVELESVQAQALAESEQTRARLAELESAQAQALAESEQARARLAELESAQAQALAESEQARARLAELEYTNTQLKEEKERLVNEVAVQRSYSAELSAAAEAKDAELIRIKSSLGWRLLSRYGPVKYRLVLPLYRRICRMLGTQSSTNDYERVVSFLKSQAVEEIAHVDGTVLPHLKGTFDLLEKWGNPPSLCMAGLCHAVYGTDDFKTTIVEISRRSELRELIGREAEALVYLFASCDRGHLYPQIGRSYAIQFRDRFTGEVFVPDSLLLKSYLELTFANELQIVGSNTARVEPTRPKFEPLFKRCRGLVSEAAYAYFVNVYRINEVQHVEQAGSPQQAQEIIQKANEGRQDIKIHLYTLCWNEARMLPYFFRHYDHLISRYFIDDNGSSDGSIEMLKAHPKVTLGHFEVHGDSFVDAARNHYNECWKQSRGQADWVIVCNIDEHIYHPNLRGYLANCKRKGISLIIPEGYNMVSDTFPQTDQPLNQIVTYGIREPSCDKPQVFDPNKINEIRFAPGRHTAALTGQVTIPEKPEVKLLHFKYLGLEYLIRRHSELRAGLRRLDIEQQWGHQYLWNEERNTEEYQRVKADATRVL